MFPWIPNDPGLIDEFTWRVQHDSTRRALRVCLVAIIYNVMSIFGFGDAEKIMPGETILIIDDEESIRETLAGVLKDDGYDVVTAASGQIGRAHV